MRDTINLRTLIYILTIFAILFFVNTTRCLAGPQLFFRQLTTDNGLINNNVYSMAQDKDGFMWFGTENGLQRYDGIDFKTFRYNPDDTLSIPGNVIYAIHKDLNDDLWVATNTGLARYNANEGNFERIGLKRDQLIQEELLFYYYVPALAESRFGIIYISWGNQGIWKYNGKENVMEPVPIKDNDGNRHELGNITNMHFDSENKLWMGSRSQGLFLYCPLQKHAQNYKEAKVNSVRSNLILSIHEDKYNRVFISHNIGLDIYCKESEKFSAYIPPMSEQSSKGNWIWQITPDQNGNLWFCSNANGLHKMNDEDLNFTSFIRDETSQGSLNDNNIHCFVEDEQGNKWVGTQRGGVNYALNSNESTIRNVKRNPFKQETLTSNRITAIKELNDSIIILGTDRGGIDFFDHKNHKNIPIDQINYPFNNAPNVILTIFVDDQDQIWSGGFLSGITIHPKNGTQFKTFLNQPGNENSLSHNDTRQIYKDSKGNIWITTNGGGLNLFHKQENRFQRFLHEPNNVNSINSNYTLTIMEDHLGYLWLGTYEGLCRIDPESGDIKRYSEYENLSGGWVYAIFEDSNMNTWVGTNLGLHRYDLQKDQFINYSNNIDLSGEIITGIMEDDSGILWIATSNGLIKFNQLNNSIIHFSTQDGLPGNAFNNGAIHKTADGRLFFGTSEGLVYFDPLKIRENRNIPPVYITEISHAPKTSNKVHVNNGNTIILSHSEAASVNFYFAALNFINASKNNYEYKLEGLDKQWNYVGNQKFATYTNLSPGKYTFQVKASNNNNHWNEEGAYIYLTIKPPFWRTNFAFGLYSLAVIFLLILIWRYSFLKVTYAGQLKIQKIKAQRAEEITKMKSEFFINVSHELSTPLSLILAPVEKLLQNELYDKKMLKSIHRNALALLRLINELIDSQRTNDQNANSDFVISDIVEFLNGITANFHEKANQNNVSLIFKSEVKSLLFKFDRNELEKAISNLISNAIKYNRPHGNVTVELNASLSKIKGHEDVQIIVSDTGYGIHPKDQPYIFDRYYRAINGTTSKKVVHKTGFGIGLYITRKVLENHKGTIEVESEENKGTSFHVKLPYDKTLLFNEVVINESMAIQSLPKAETLNQIQKNPKKKKYTILIAEDNLELLDFLKTIFEQDYNVFTAENGSKALCLAEKTQVNIIVTDIMMPEVSGIELCQQIKTNLYTSHIPVIMLTALNSGDTIIESYELGADDYVSKPFNPEILLARVKNIINSREFLKKKFITEVKTDPKEITFTSKDETFLSSLVEKIENNLENEEFNNDSLATEMNMTSMTLYRKVKSLTGQSINPFIRTVRLKKAANLLKTGEVTVQEAAYNSGFNDIKYFRKCFQKQFGKNPSDLIAKNSDFLNLNYNGSYRYLD